MVAINEYTDRWHCLQYDGTNGQTIADLVDGTVQSDDGTTVVIPYFGGTITLTVGEWFVGHYTGNEDLLYQSEWAQDPADFFERIIPVPQNGGGGLSVALLSSSGTAAVPGSLLGETQTIDVTVTPSLHSTDAVPFAQLRGSPGVLGGHGVQDVQLLDTSTVRVVIESAASSAAASVHAQALEIAETS